MLDFGTVATVVFFVFHLIIYSVDVQSNLSIVVTWGSLTK